MNERGITHALIEELGSFVLSADFQGDLEYPRYDGALLEPLKKLASDACSSIGRSHSEKVQVRDIVAVAPDHGELWGLPTTAVPTKDGITTVWHGLRFGYRLTRKLYLEGPTSSPSTR